MKRIFLALALACAAVSVRAEDGIEATIKSQIEAFRGGEFAAAFEYASPNIQRIFRDPQNFEAMVRQGFGVMLNPVDMQFLGLRDEGGALWQRVLYRDLHGEVYLFDYAMIEGPEGWKIDAVVRVRMPSPSA